MNSEEPMMSLKEFKQLLASYTGNPYVSTVCDGYSQPIRTSASKNGSFFN
jgi:hypothetical protein